MAADTTLSTKKRAIEAHLQAFQLPESSLPVTIPVVFQVLQEAPISRDRLLAQLDALNRDFAGQFLPAPTRQAEAFLSNQAVDLGIRFCLAEGPLPTHLTEGGVVYQTSDRVWTTDDALKSAATDGLDPWNTERYLNIWIADLEDGTAGYAQMPGGPTATDGLVLDARYLATTEADTARRAGRTLTHLVGSYLGLYELWQPDCGDDYCADTPIHNDPNAGCELYKHLSFCPPHAAEMTMNFMDMGTGDCEPYLFTLDQSRRMRGVLNPDGPRAGLVGGPVNCAVDLPVVAGSQKREGAAATPDVALRVQLLPNPARTEVVLQLGGPSHPSAEVLVYDQLGRLYYEATTGVPDRLDLRTRDWPPGTYYVFVRADRQVQTHQLILLPR